LHFKRFACLVAAALTVGATGTTATAMAGLTGAGSTLVQPLAQNWAQAFQSQTGNSVVYSGVGSGAGITQISNRTVDFGASDAPLNPTQAANCHSCVQIPWALSATAVGFHIGNLRKLKLNGVTLAQIYLGQITSWNDVRIRRQNKGTKLPALKITPVFRSDGSGDTYAFTDFLTRVDSQWRGSVGNATTVSFPAGVGGKGNAGITAIVASTDGAIGYIAASYLIAHGLPAVAVKNNAGKYEYPNLNNIESAAQAVHSVPSGNELHIVNPPKSAKIAYPISTFTYAIVPQVPAQKALLQSFINFAIGQAGQRYGAALDFAPLPSVVLNAAQATVNGLQ
jgi:phosphate transport system substrate-binding protein